MASVNDDEGEVEYVELLDYETTDEKELAIDTNVEEVPQVILPDDGESLQQIEEVEYLETHDLEGPHTIIVHGGRQYVIPTEQLQQAGNTIVLEDDVDETGEEYTENEDTENKVFYEEVEDEGTNLNGQYAVLKDGKLHIQESTEECEEIQEKLRVLEHTLNNFEDPEPSEENSESLESSQDDSEALAQITGKNLITGQTISLSGFLEKIRRKGLGDVTSNPVHRRVSVKTEERSPSSDYILVPPVNKKVVVGRTSDGRRLVGRILQIQKKVGPLTVEPPVKRRPQQRQPRVPKKIYPPPSDSPDSPEGSGGPQTGHIPQYSALQDSNISRTLAGLMDLESVSRSLLGRRLIVRHVQRRSVGGKALAGTRRVAYYSGRMAKGPNNWEFCADPPSNKIEGIDLPIEENDQQVKIDEDGIVYNSAEDDLIEEEPITLYLTVTQDEFGKKRTKVSIPQLANNPNKKPKIEDNTRSDISVKHCCQVCGKKFQTTGSLRRHASVHDPTLRPLQCMTCLARFTDSSSLKKHLLLHSGIRPHVCTVCGKNFAHRGDLNFHSRTHDPVKRFKCEVCGKEFHRHSNMIRHADIHRQRTSDNGDDCNNVTIATDDNNSNETRRPPFICDTCGCHFNFISSLTRHIVIHHMTGNEEST